MGSIFKPIFISFLLIALTSAFAKTAEQSEELKKQQQRNGVSSSLCNGGINERFEKPGSCRQYYHCLNYILYTLDCPKSTAFNARTRKCESAASIPGCEGYQPPCTSNGELLTTEPMEIPGSCYNYYQCLNGQLLNFKCPEGSAFNPKIGQCDYEMNVWECGSK